MRKYFGCHNHTMYSNLRLLDCINRPADLIKKAIELGLSGIAITDHEALGCHVEVNKIAQDLIKQGSDFKLALGNEIYLVNDRSSGQKYYHFILIAKDEIGHKALRELSSTAWYYSYSDRGMERVPTLKSELTDIVTKYKGHLIATSACIGGELSTNALAFANARAVNDMKNAQKYYNNILEFLSLCQELFADDFYIECAPSTYADQILVNKTLQGIAKAFNIKMVIGTDAHYLTAADRPVHTAYLTSKDGDRETADFYQFAYLMDSDEVTKYLSKSYDIEFINEMFDNSIELQNKVENYSLFHKQDIPRVDVKDYPKAANVRYGKGGKSIPYEVIQIEKYPTLSKMFQDDDIQNRYWVNECWNKLFELGKLNDTYLTELEEEARVKSVISEKLETNMFRYPNTLQHYIDMIWDCGSMVGAGRGSSCAALNHYLMGITQLDPIEWDLPFFRYMNDERVELGCLILILPSCKKTV